MGHLAAEPVAQLLAERFGQPTETGLHVHHDLTQEELAQLVGASRETVNKALADFAQRGWLRVHGKGQKERILPLRGPILAELRLLLTVDLPHVGRPPEPDDYLLYPVHKQAAGKGEANQILWAHKADPKARPAPQTVHRWWYRQAQAAGLVGPGVTSGLNMHRARHTFAMELRRVAGIDAASHALGHSDLSTTLGIYGHRDASDLETAMEKYAAWIKTTDVPPDEA